MDWTSESMYHEKTPRDKESEKENDDVEGSADTCDVLKKIRSKFLEAKRKSKLDAAATRLRESHDSKRTEKTSGDFDGNLFGSKESGFAEDRGR